MKYMDDYNIFNNNIPFFNLMHNIIDCVINSGKKIFNNFNNSVSIVSYKHNIDPESLEEFNEYVKKDFI